MTNREFYNAVINMNTLTDAERAEVITKAAELKAKVEADLAKASAKRAEKAKENLPLLETLAGLLTDEAITTSDLAKAAGLSTPKASYLLRELVEAGVAGVKDKKANGRTAKAYFKGEVAFEDVFGAEESDADAE